VLYREASQSAAGRPVAALAAIPDVLLSGMTDRDGGASVN